MITFDDTLALVRQAYPCDKKCRFFDNSKNSKLKTTLLSFLDTMMNATIGWDFNRELTFD